MVGYGAEPGVGSTWNLAQRQVAYIISGLLAIRYRIEPIISLYLLISFDEPIFRSSLVALAIGVEVELYGMPNLFKIFLVCLD